MDCIVSLYTFYCVHVKCLSREESASTRSHRLVVRAPGPSRRGCAAASGFLLGELSGRDWLLPIELGCCERSSANDRPISSQAMTFYDIMHYVPISITRFNLGLRCLLSLRASLLRAVQLAQLLARTSATSSGFTQCLRRPRSS